MSRAYVNSEVKEKSFLMPDEVFTLGLNQGEISLYAYLKHCENWKTNTTWPSYKTIRSAIGMCPNTIRKYVRSLADKHLIEVEPTTLITKDGWERNANLRFTILPISEAVECYLKRQMEAARLEAAKQKATKKLEAFDRTHPA